MKLFSHLLLIGLALFCSSCCHRLQGDPPDPLKGLALSESPVAIANQVRLYMLTNKPLSDESKKWALKPVFDLREPQAREACRILLLKLARSGHILIDPQASLVLHAHVDKEKQLIFRLIDQGSPLWQYKAAHYAKERGR